MKKPKTYVFCTTQFEFIHHWPNATSDVSYLQHPHRHIFHVKVIVNSTLDNKRNVEFIGLKKNVDDIVSRYGQNYWPASISCEMMASSIKEKLETYYSNIIKVHSVEVSEDGENGAIVSW